MEEIIETDTLKTMNHEVEALILEADDFMQNNNLEVEELVISKCLVPKTYSQGSA